MALLFDFILMSWIGKSRHVSHAGGIPGQRNRELKLDIPKPHGFISSIWSQPGNEHKSKTRKRSDGSSPREHEEGVCISWLGSTQLKAFMFVLVRRKHMRPFNALLLQNSWESSSRLGVGTVSQCPNDCILSFLHCPWQLRLSTTCLQAL